MGAEMASLVRLLVFLAVVVGGPVLAGFLVAPGSWGDERFDFPDEPPPPENPKLVALADPPSLQPEIGWWSAPSAPGLGILVDRGGSRLMVAALAYEPDGRASWTLAAGSLGCGSDFTAALAVLSGGQTLSGRARKPPTAREIGRIGIHFQSPTQASLTLPNGRRIGIEKFQLEGATPSAFAPEPGWWWNQAEPSRAFAIESRNGALLLTGAAYDEPGQPVWYVAHGPLSDERGFRSRWYRLSGGMTLEGRYRAPEARDAGPVALRFTDPGAALLTLPDGRALPITRFDPASGRGLLAPINVADAADGCAPTTPVKVAHAG
jgi:hypothetical protein